MLLTYDLATRTGWCAGRPDEEPELGHFTLPETDKDVGAFLLPFRRRIVRQLEQIQPERVVFEQPIMPYPHVDWAKRKVSFKTNIWTTRKLQGLAGVLEMECAERQIPCCEVNVQDVKRALAGYGGADKADMMHVAKKCGLKPKVHDEADAFGVYLVAVSLFHRKHQQMWDKKIYGPRAAVGAPGLL